MDRFRFVLLFGLSIAGLTVGNGCKMCDPCYPLGGLIGKGGQECTCENCSTAPRVGSIIDAPQEITEAAEKIDPSRPSTSSAATGPDTTTSPPSGEPVPTTGP